MYTIRQYLVSDALNKKQIITLSICMKNGHLTIQTISPVWDCRLTHLPEVEHRKFEGHVTLNEDEYQKICPVKI